MTDLTPIESDDMPVVVDADSADAMTIDARGLRCPLPLLRAKQALRTLSDGALLIVLADDGASQRDFQAYAKISGHNLERCIEQAGEFTYWLRKTAPISRD